MDKKTSNSQKVINYFIKILHNDTYDQIDWRSPKLKKLIQSVISHGVMAQRMTRALNGNTELEDLLVRISKNSTDPKDNQNFNRILSLSKDFFR